MGPVSPEAYKFPDDGALPQLSMFTEEPEDYEEPHNE